MKQRVEDIVFRYREEWILTTPVKELPNNPCNRRLTKKERATALKMLERNVSPLDVAMHFGVQDSSIYRMRSKAKKKAA